MYSEYKIKDEFFLMSFKKMVRPTLMSNGGDNKVSDIERRVVCDYVSKVGKNNENQVSSQVPWFTAKI